MVRAAVSGAINYAVADPYNKMWQIKHNLILQEVARQEDEKLILALQRHWLSYVANSALERDSWTRVKNSAAEALKNLLNTTFPWREIDETAGEKDTIESKYGDLIKQYREMVSQAAADQTSAEPEN